MSGKASGVRVGQKTWILTVSHVVITCSTWDVVNAMMVSVTWFGIHVVRVVPILGDALRSEPCHGHHTNDDAQNADANAKEGKLGWCVASVAPAVPGKRNDSEVGENYIQWKLGF